MPGDHSRFTFDARRRFAGVRMQQGRVQLDADWNEEHDILAERTRLLALDVGGTAWLPEDTTPDAFLVGIIPGDLSLGEGRLWLDGRLAEIFPGEGVTYLKQPFLPDPPAIVAGGAIVFLDLWERDVSWAEDPRLLDVALGGIDTTTRVQQVWQVKLQPDQGAACGTDLAALFPPSAGRLTTQAVAPPAPDDPCILPPIAGYRGIENRLYRVEIQVPGALGTAKFKWSRDNASIMARVSALAVAGGQTRVSVNRIGRDEVLRFRIGDWVTLTDDTREFHAESGQMARIADIDEANRVVVLDRAVPTAGGRAFATTAAAHATRATRLQRWDESAPINSLDADGLMTTGAGPIGLEDGVELLFSVSPAGGSFQIGDYWVFAARTADASVEVLSAAPPRGIRHQRLQLAAISATGGITDCRPMRPQGEGCCTFVVAPGGDIQAAIDALPDAGGCVCLKAGRHLIEAPIDISRPGVHLHGESLGTIVETAGTSALLILKAPGTRVDTIDFRQPEAGRDPAIIIAGAEDIGLHDCRILTGGRVGNTSVFITESDGVALTELRFDHAVLGVLAEGGSADIRIENCEFAMESPNAILPNSAAIALTQVRGNVAILGCIIDDALNGIIVNENSKDPTSRAVAAMIRGNRIDLAKAETADRCHGIDVASPAAQVLDNVISHRGGDLTGIRLSGQAAQARGNTIVSRADSQALNIAISAGSVAGGATKAGSIRQIVIADNVIEGRQHGIALGSVVRGEVRGNSFGRAGLANGVGIALLDCDDCRVDGNSIAGAFIGIAAYQGARNRLSANMVSGGKASITIIDEAAPTIADNTISGPDDAGILTINTTQRVAITSNRLNHCGSAAELATAIAGANVFGEWQVSSNEILDTGIAPDSTAAGAKAAVGIFGLLILEARIESNLVSYATPVRPLTGEDRAMMISGYLEFDSAALTIGYPCHVHNNSFVGPGASALVEVKGLVITDNYAVRFERLLYSGNYHWHWNAASPGGATIVASVNAFAGGGSLATVQLAAARLTVSGNQVKANTKGFPSWNLNDTGGPFIGNVSSGVVLDRTLPANQFPAPASAFNN